MSKNEITQHSDTDPVKQYRASGGHLMRRQSTRILMIRPARIGHPDDVCRAGYQPGGYQHRAVNVDRDSLVSNSLDHTEEHAKLREI